ncbi:MAG: hypothetical protein H0V01_07305 [Bacteroidetes bacterium]|nr:hypothetical protein [Bacteroidota bacterium]HET6244165.1 hypothetical protein [Bacteroidia bacterium]
MGILLALIYSLLFIFLIYRLDFFKVEGLSSKAIPGIFLLKILCGFILWLIYTHFYNYRDTSDAFKYFDDAAIIYNSLFVNPLHFLQMLSGVNAEGEHLMVYYEQTTHWFKEYDYGLYNDNRTVIRLNAFVYLFSFGHYAVHIVFWCFLSLSGLVAIFKMIHPILTDKTKELVFAVFLLPSVLFWGSGVLKEGILLFSFGLFLYYFNKIVYEKFSIKSLAWITGTFILLIFTKGYVLLALIPSIASLTVIKVTSNKYIGLKFALTHLVVLLIAINLYRIDQEFDVLFYLFQKQKDFINVAELMDAKSFIKTRIFEPNWKSLFLNTPEAVFNVLTRPFIFESTGILILAAALENLMIMGIAILFICFYKKPNKEQLPLLFFSVFFVLSLAAIIGFVTPILGAIVRYKIPLLPFLLTIFIIFLDKDKLIEKFSFFKFLK